MQMSPYVTLTLHCGRSAAGFSKRNNYNASLLATIKAVKQMHNMRASAQLMRVTQGRKSGIRGPRVHVASIEVMKPGADGERHHAEEQRVQYCEIHMAGAEKNDEQHVGELEKGGPLSEKRRGDIDVGFDELRHRGPQQQHGIPTDDNNGDPRWNQVD